MTTNPDSRASRRAALVAAGALDGDLTELAQVAGDALEGYKPKVPVVVRDVAYWVTLGAAAASALATGLAGIWWPDIAPQVLATGGVVTTVTGIIGGGVGVIYRPGAQR